MQIDRPSFEGALVLLLDRLRVLPGKQQLLIANLDEAELVTVRGGGREAFEIWIPEFESIVGEDVELARFEWADVTLYVAGPPPADWSGSRVDVRMVIVDRRPLFPGPHT